MRPLQLVPSVVLFATIGLAGWGAASLADFGSSGIEDAAARIGGAAAGATSSSADVQHSGRPVVATSYLRLPEPEVAPVSFGEAATAEPVPDKPAVASAAMPASGEPPADPEPAETAFVLASVVAAEAPAVEASLPDSPPPPPEKRVKLASLFTSDPGEEHAKPVVRLVETPNECLVAEICIDDYLWALYERTPKIDTNKVTERIKVTVKHKGKTRTVTKTKTKYVVGDFTWKDPIAAQRAGMSLKDYVIGGMDRGFKRKLYHALRQMDDAGLMPGITSAFRDDYRQAIAAGNKAASDSSFHGGSRRGGYGYGLAADLVSVRGETRMQRLASSAELWKWIDAREKELKVGRPYLDRDPPHVGPIDGREYVAKRSGRMNAKKAGSRTKTAQKPGAPAKTAQKPGLGTKKPALAGRNEGATKPAKPAKPAKVSSLQNGASVRR
jgi:hypothetical protein